MLLENVRKFLRKMIRKLDGKQVMTQLELNENAESMNRKKSSSKFWITY